MEALIIMRHGLIALGLLVGIAAGAYSSRKPWVEFNEQRQKAECARREAQELDQQRASLLKVTASIENPLGMETTARQLGYHRDGEVRLTSL